MSYPIVRGSTDKSTVIRIVDATDGTPETAVEHNTSGIDLWYRRENGLRVAITEAALAALNSAHTDGGIEHIGDGYYRLDLPDAAWASGADYVTVGGTVTGMVVLGTTHPLVAQVALDGNGRVDVGAIAGQTATASAGVTFPATIASPTNITAGTITTVSGNVNGLVGGVVGNVSGNVIGSVGSVAGNVSGSVASVVGNVGGNVAGNVTGSVGSVVGNVGGNVVGSVASVVAVVSADVVEVAGITVAGSGTTASPWGPA